MQEFKTNQVVRITETHECNGMSLHKGMIGYVYGGDTYETLGPDEIPVTFSFSNQEFLGVNKAKLEVFRGDIAALSAKSLAAERLELRLRDIQQRYLNLGNLKMVGIIRDMRRHFHAKTLIEVLDWDPKDSEDDFDTAERILQLAGAPPYRIDPVGKLPN